MNQTQDGAYHGRPYPIVSLHPGLARLPDHARRHHVVCEISVRMSDGSRFHGVIAFDGFVNFDDDDDTQLALFYLREEDHHMANVQLSRDLTAADDGAYQFTIVAVQGAVSSLPAMLTVVIGPPPAVVTPATPSLGTSDIPNLADNSPAGTVLTTLTQGPNSDGSTFTGSYVITDQNGNPAPLAVV